MTTPELEAIRYSTNISIAQTYMLSRSGNTYRPELSSLLSDGASDGRALHLTLGVDDLRTTN
jgi:hypothetical protein